MRLKKSIALTALLIFSAPLVFMSHHAEAPKSTIVAKKINKKQQKQEERKPLIGRVRMLSAGDSAVEYKGEVAIYEVTAYTAGYESTGKRSGDPSYGITASGATVLEGRTIACPRDLDFGTSVYIPALNRRYICEDRGSAITRGHIDIFMQSLDKALAFGRQRLTVVISEVN